MKISFCLVVTILLLFQPKNIQIKTSEIEINVLDNPLGNELRVLEVGGDDYNLPKGLSIIPESSAIYDADWQHKTVFLLPNINSSIYFTKDKDGFWIGKDKNGKDLYEVNFDVSYRKNIDPIKRVSWGNIFNNIKYITNLHSRDKAIVDYYNIKRSYLGKYVDKFKLNDESFEKWKSQIYYEEIATRTDLDNFYGKFPEQYLRSLLKGIYLDNEKDLFLPSYRKTLWNILYLKYYLKYGNQEILLKSIFEIASSDFSGSDKDYLKFYLLIIALDSKRNIKFSKDIYKTLLDKFINESKNSYYKEYLIKNKLPDNYLNTNEQLMNLNQEVVNFSNLYDKKSIIYVDFWASWCAPCRAEMPASKKLYEEYNKKGVDFLYISIDDNPAAWGRAVKQLNLPKEINYLILNTKKSQLLRKYNINSIPRYIILKDGKIIYSDAPRPSDNRIHSIFDSILKI